MSRSSTNTLPAVRLHQTDDVSQRHAFAGAASAQQAEGFALRMSNDTSSSTASDPKRFDTRSKRTAAWRLRHPTPADKRKKMIFTRTTSPRMMSIDPITTLRVDASPTPSVPRLVVNPR